MLIVGEKINTSIPGISEAVEGKDVLFIQNLAKRQVEAGANVIDVNVGTRIHSEAEDMRWLVKTIQSAIDVPLSIDSPNPEALRMGLKEHKGRAMLNSITGESKRVKDILPLLKEFRPSVIALTMDDGGIPQDAETRYQISQRLVELLSSAGIPEDNMYMDPLMRPISTDSEAGLAVLDSIRKIKNSSKEIHVICGLSNISFGLPKRGLINRAFLLMAMAQGLDSVILDPLDRKLISLIRAGEALLGKDKYCAGYLRAFRADELAEE